MWIGIVGGLSKLSVRGSTARANNDPAPMVSAANKAKINRLNAVTTCGGYTPQKSSCRWSYYSD